MPLVFWMGEMAKRIPLDLEEPIRLVIERDHVAQGRYLGAIGEAVLTPVGAVHVVYHPRDEHAYLHRIAQSLLDRAGLADALPHWIENGAALWLSQRWFGQGWQAWLPLLAAADLLPSAEQLLAADRQEDGSAPLWTPAAASLVAALPGETARQKLRAVPGVASPYLLKFNICAHSIFATSPLLLYHVCSTQCQVESPTVHSRTEIIQ